MKNYVIVDPDRQPKRESPQELYSDVDLSAIILEVQADFIYAQPSGVSTLHRYRPDNPSKSDIVAVVPANLLILEV